MFARSILRSAAPAVRSFSTTPSCLTKVAVLGAGGGIGQPLSLLLKNDPLVTSLSLYDIRGAPGVAADVSHVDTASEVSYSQYPRVHFTNDVFRSEVTRQTNSTRL